MGNAKHPRTGKIGYKTEWTDNDFYEFFNITEEEQNTIKEYIDNADKRLEEWKQTNHKK
jgi:REP element-mobilizing transposase RayT